MYVYIRLHACINGVLIYICTYVHILFPILQYAVVYKSRNNSGMIKKNVILWITEAVNKGSTYSHTVNLDHPDLVILVEIIKVSSYCYRLSNE